MVTREPGESPEERTSGDFSLMVKISRDYAFGDEEEQTPH